MNVGGELLSAGGQVVPNRPPGVGPSMQASSSDSRSLPPASLKGHLRGRGGTLQAPGALQVILGSAGAAWGLPLSLLPSSNDFSFSCF